MDNQFKKNFLKGSAAASIGTVGGMVFQFLSIVLLTRFITKDDFGIYVLILAVINLFEIFGGFGLEVTLVQFISGVKGERRKKILVPVLIVRIAVLMVIGIIFYFGGNFIVKYFDQKIIKYVLPITFLFILSSFRSLFYSLLQGLNYFKKFSYVNFFSSLLRPCLIYLYFILNKLNLDSLIVIEIFLTAVPILHQIFYIPFRSLISWNFETKTFKDIIKFSYPLYLNDILSFMLGRANIFVIGLYLNPVSVAHYDVATKAPMALKKVYKSFFIVYFPNLTKLFSIKDNSSAMQLINRALVVTSTLITFLVLISFLFSRELVILLFSERYLAAMLAFALLMLNFLIRTISDLMGYSIVSYGRSTVPVKINILSSILSVGGAFVLIPLYGFMGAVYSSIIMNVVSLTLFYIALANSGIKPDFFPIAKPFLITMAIIIIYFLVGAETLTVKILFVVVDLIVSWFLVKDYRRLFYFIRKSVLKIKLSKSN